MRHLRKQLTAVVLACALPLSAGADDTELFTTFATQTGVRPNVLIILDNSSNWNATFGNVILGCGNTKFCNEVDALNKSIDAIPGNVNVGLMMFAETGTNGGYVRYAVRQMDGANKTQFKSMMSSLVPNGSNNDNSGSNQPYGKVMFEAFKYLGGHTSPANATNNVAGTPVDSTHFGTTAFAGGRSNNNGAKKRDCPNNADNPFAGPLAGNAFSTCSGSGEDTYISPITAAGGECQVNYILFISNGNPSTGGDSGNPTASTLLGNVGGNTTGLNPPNHASTADEWARFLANTDVSPLSGQQPIITYTLAVYQPQSYDADGDPVPSNSDGEMIKLMKSAGKQGGDNGYFEATTTQELEAAFNTIFRRIQSTNNAYASVTLPVSTSIRGTNLNQIYLGVFRPQQNNRPRWDGNLKEYQLAYENATDSIFLSDVTGTRHVESATGFVVDDAVSFWTSPSNYWAFDPSGNPSSASDWPDGAVVEKGGHSQRIRQVYPNPDSNAAQTRNMYTCTGSCTSGTSLSSMPFNTTDNDPSSPLNPNSPVIQAMFGASAAETSGTINWVRGKDNIEDENGDASATDIRAHIHGDIIHSRPAVINYNRYGNDNDVVAFYGSNDGLFRAVKGGTGANDGYEKWIFVAEEFFGKLKRQRDNFPNNDLPPYDLPENYNTPYSVNLKDYFFDGSIGVYTKDANNDGKLESIAGDKVWIFLSARRGGRFIYALDVSNPDDPKFMWKKGCFGLAPVLCSAGYSELGYTWSEPKTAKIKANLGNSSNPDNIVLIFGAGYDPLIEDQDPVIDPLSNLIGRGIFVVDAENGNVFWQANPSPSGATYNKTVTDMTYAIPSDVALLDRNGDKFIDRGYVGDTGGNVWRIDLGDPSPANWAVNKLASVGVASSSSNTDRRKFLHPPSVVANANSLGIFDAVLIGSGDREHPLQGIGDINHPAGNAVANRYYMFKDRSTGSTFTGAGSGAGGVIVASDLYDITSNADGANQVPLDDEGWVLNLGTAEKVVSSSLTQAGATQFNTHTPSFPDAGSCNSLGNAKLYTINYKNGAAFTDANADGNYASSDRYYSGVGGKFTGLASNPVPFIVPYWVDSNGNKTFQNPGTGAPPDGFDGGSCSGTHCRRADPAFGARIRTFWHQKLD
jgi:type IV pilus assembly protein PilY1